VLIAALGSLGERLDAKFISAYFFPAFVAVLGTIVILVRTLGGERFVEWLEQSDSTKEALTALVLVLLTLMVAEMLRAMARPIARWYIGRAFPELIKHPSLQHQLRARARARIGLGMVLRGDRLFPHDPTDTEPTAFGNVVAAGVDYPRLIYAMDTYHWWPRLLPLLPAEFQEQLRSLESPMRSMLNLSLVSLYLGCLAALSLGLAHSNWIATVVALVVGLLVANFFYRAAIAQAVELVRNIWVGFDLYRYEILKQMNVELPTTLEDERALWQRLTQRLRLFEEPVTIARTEDDASASQS
jgi:hypothetical protein